MDITTHLTCVLCLRQASILTLATLAALAALAAAPTNRHDTEHHLRRDAGYELGGAERMEVGAVFSFMWLFFVSLSITQFHGGFDGVGAVRVHYRSHYRIINHAN